MKTYFQKMFKKTRRIEKNIFLLCNVALLVLIMVFVWAAYTPEENKISFTPETIAQTVEDIAKPDLEPVASIETATPETKASVKLTEDIKLSDKNTVEDSESKITTLIAKDNNYTQEKNTEVVITTPTNTVETDVPDITEPTVIYTESTIPETEAPTEPPVEETTEVTEEPTISETEASTEPPVEETTVPETETTPTEPVEEPTEPANEDVLTFLKGEYGYSYGTRPNPSIDITIDKNNNGKNYTGEVDTSNFEYVGEHAITGYDPYCSHCCSGTGLMASGIHAVNGYSVAAGAYPIGTTLYIEGYGFYVVEDRGGAVNGKHIDIAAPSHQACYDLTSSGVGVYIVPNNN